MIRNVHVRPARTAVAMALALLCGAASAADQAGSPSRLRTLIDQAVGGIQKLFVPADNASIPVPPPPPPGSGLEPDRYMTTEAKRYLGKMLFHDPVRTARINANQGQPMDLPAGTAFGGTVWASNPNVQAIVAATKQSGSCGSCHFGEAATKAGTRINLHVGAEGRSYTDEAGNFIARRRTQAILVTKRDKPLFAGDTLVDALPTLTDIWCFTAAPAGMAPGYVCPPGAGQPLVSTPAPYYHAELPAPTALLATGRLDELDSVGRLSMSVIGFAYNNRLLFGGFAGEPQTTPGSLNPFNDPAGENLTLLLLDAHRMIGLQSDAILANPNKPVFVKLFRDAFPTEAAKSDASGQLGDLVNDMTILRATATFLRTTVTRNTPFDKFLAGNDRALTLSQQRGARLFFTQASAGGAGCFTCHSGPMLNKQFNDPDAAGIGALVDENFFNIGIGDHPVQALNALARGKLDPNKPGPDGFPYHAEDIGRQEVTQKADKSDLFKFRSLTLRQLKDAGNFMHNGSFTQVRDVVAYFNAGVPQDATAGAAPTLSSRFTTPRGPGSQQGLGLSEAQVDELTDFIENGLYDPAFRKFDPNSTTESFQPNERDLTYSKYRPDLAALGAKDGFVISGLATDNNDPLSRRDQGLEFLDVTAQASIRLTDRRNSDGQQTDVYQITNNSTSVIDTHMLVVTKGLPGGSRLVNGSGKTSGGDPYLRVFLPNGVILPGQSIATTLVFRRGERQPPLNYTLGLLSGQGKP